MLFQIFAKDWLPTVFIRALHRLEQAVLKVVLQQATTGQWGTEQGIGKGSGCKAWGGRRRGGPWGSRRTAGRAGRGTTCCLCWGQGMERAVCMEAAKASLVWRTGLRRWVMKEASEFILDHLLTCSRSQVSPWTSSLALPINLPAPQGHFFFRPPCPPQHQVQISALCCCLVTHLCPTLCDPVACSPPGSSAHGDSLGKNAGVGCHALLQGIFPTQGSNLHPENWQVFSLLLSHQGSTGW